MFSSPFENGNRRQDGGDEGYDYVFDHDFNERNLTCTVSIPPRQGHGWIGLLFHRKNHLVIVELWKLRQTLS